MSPRIVLSGRTQAALRRLKQALRERRLLRDRLAREHAMALLERGRQAKRKATEGGGA
jgi:hypothetical protein